MGVAPFRARSHGWTFAPATPAAVATATVKRPLGMSCNRVSKQCRHKETAAAVASSGGAATTAAAAGRRCGGRGGGGSGSDFQGPRPPIWVPHAWAPRAPLRFLVFVSPPPPPDQTPPGPTLTERSISHRPEGFKFTEDSLVCSLNVL